MPPIEPPPTKLSFWTGTRPGLETLALLSVPSLVLGGVLGALTHPRTGFYATFVLLAVTTLLMLRVRRTRANAAPADDRPPPD